MMKEWQKQLLSIPKKEMINESLYEMMKIFYQAFPCRITQTFQYSSFNDTFSGILSYEHPNLQSIHYVHEMMKVNRYVHEAIRADEVRFFNSNEFQLSMSNQFVLSEPIKNMLLIPFSINHVVIGFMTGVNIQFKVDEKAIQELDVFRHLCIQSLQLRTYPETPQFTEKELIVMQHIANGLATKEISEIIQITDSTVKYFLKNVMIKTSSANRTEAVTKLFRLGLLS